MSCGSNSHFDKGSFMVERYDGCRGGFYRDWSNTTEDVVQTRPSHVGAVLDVWLDVVRGARSAPLTTSNHTFETRPPCGRSLYQGGFCREDSSTSQGCLLNPPPPPV